MSIITNILKNRGIKEYQPISIVQPLNKKYTIEYKSNKYSCQVSHILYTPVAILLELPEPNDIIFESNCIYNLSTLSCTNELPIVLKLCLLQVINVNNKKIWLFEVVDVSFSRSILELFYLKRIYGHSKAKNVNFIENFNFKHFTKLVALFSQPKKVFLVTLFQNNRQHNFPVDLCAELSNFVVIGIRNTNNAAKALIMNSEFYISSVLASKHKEIYSFGKFGSNNMKDHAEDTKKLPTELICDVKKVRLKQIIRMEYQTIYCNEIIEYKQLRDENESLFHLHKFWFLHTNNSLKFEFV